MKTTKSMEESIYLLPSSSYRYIQVSKYLADANQPALEIRSDFFPFFLHGSRKL